MLRHSETFGKKDYTEKQLDVYFKRVKFMDEDIFVDVMDEIICLNKAYPTVPDFLKCYDEVMKYRRKKASQEKAFDLSNIESSESIFTQEEKRGFFDLLQRILSKKASQEDIDSTVRYIKTRLELAGKVYTCNHCSDTGWKFFRGKNNYTYWQKCECEAGSHV